MLLVINTNCFIEQESTIIMIALIINFKVKSDININISIVSVV